MNILITDGHNRSSLAVTRSLGAKGHNIIVAGLSSNSLASASRFSSRGVTVPDPLKFGDDYKISILNIAIRENIDLIYPMTEQSIYLLNSLRGKELKNVTLACPSQDMMLAVSDKVQLFQLAHKLGVDTPQTFYLKNSDDLEEVTESIDLYPVVVKPAQSRVKVGNQFISGSVCYAGNRTELAKLYATNPVLQFPSMIQEKIVGPGTGLFTLYDKNRHLALFSHKRLREKPPSGGVSVVSESVPLDNEMIETADKLLSAVGFEGVAMVEFKRDLRDGKAKLMEINGRFWGTLQLAVACGVDFPALYLDYLLGKKSKNLATQYKEGQKLKWFLGTLDHLLIRLKNSDEILNLPPGSPSKAKAVWEFMRLWEGKTTFDVFDLHDLAPFLFEAKAYIKYAIKRAKG